MTKKFLVLAMAFFAFIAVNAFSVVDPSNKAPLASEIMVPINKSGKLISLAELATISPKKFAEYTGKKMTLAEKVALKISQRQLRSSINADGTVNSAKLKKFSKKAGGGGLHGGGFALGFFLGLIGVLLAYVVFDDENKQRRIKGSWIGLIAAVVFYLVLVLAVFSAL